MAAIKIRKAQIKDGSVVADLWHKYELHEHELDSRIAVSPMSSYKRQFEEMLENRSGVIALAECDSGVVGVIDYIAYRKGALRIGSIGNVFVLEGYRGRGIGSELIEYATDKLKGQKCRYIVSGVRVNNIEAQKFWKKSGFDIDVESIANYSMRKKLSEE